MTLGQRYIVTYLYRYYRDGWKYLMKFEEQRYVHVVAKYMYAEHAVDDDHRQRYMYLVV